MSDIYTDAEVELDFPGMCEYLRISVWIADKTWLHWTSLQYRACAIVDSQGLMKLFCHDIHPTAPCIHSTCVCRARDKGGFTLPM